VSYICAGPHSEGERSLQPVAVAETPIPTVTGHQYAILWSSKFDQLRPPEALSKYPSTESLSFHARFFIFLSQIVILINAMATYFLTALRFGQLPELGPLALVSLIA
jgi:hypothetical protein